MPTLHSTPLSTISRVAAALLALLLLSPAAARAQQPKVQVDAPLLALARSGAHTPLHVTIATTEPMEGRVLVNFGNSAPEVVRPFQVGRNSVRRITVPVVTPDWSPEISVQVYRGRELLVTEALKGASGSMGLDRLHVVAVGEDPLGLTLLREVTNKPVIGHAGCTEESRPVQVETLLPTELPNVWFTWTSVDLVVWRRPDPSVLTPEQQAALRDWVHSGGTLLVALGDNHRSWSASPLGALSGAEVRSVDPSDAALATVLSAAGASDAADGSTLPHVALLPMGARARLSSGDDPIVVDHGVGAGRVVTLGFDPAAGELRGLLDRETFWRRLLGLGERGGRSPDTAVAGPPAQRPSQPCAGSPSDWGGWTGENAHLRRSTWRNNVIAALSSFSRANPLPLGTVLLFGVIYLLLIGPVDFFLGRKVGKPMLTWVTFPAIAIAFSVFAALLISFSKAGDTEVRCVEVVDVFGGTTSVRGSGWCAMWSSHRQDVRIPVPRGAGVVQGSGGASMSEDTLSRSEIAALAEPTRIGLGYRASQWAVSTWHSAWLDSVDGGFAAVSRDDGVVVTNQSGIDLDEAFLASGGSLWPLGPLAHGASATVSLPGPGFDWQVVTGGPRSTTGDDSYVEYDDPDYYRQLDGQEPWYASWAMLRDPHSEHVARLPMPGLEASPVLLGRVTGGVAPPVPEGDDLVFEAFAIVRAPLPDLDPEDLP